jgi:hypothetical protein
MFWIYFNKYIVTNWIIAYLLFLYANVAQSTESDEKLFRK